jgi:hypothetical protein
MLQNVKMNVLSFFACIVVLAASPPVFGSFEQHNYLRLDNGYRWDKVSNRVFLASDTIGVRAATQIMSAINSYQLGASGKWAFLGPLYVKGSAHYGWVFSGNYNEIAFEGGARGHTWDATGGLGFLFQMGNCWGVAPTAGWGYDELYLIGTAVTTNQILTAGRRTGIGSINCKSTFQGPWVGADILFQPACCFELTLSYELHRDEWRGQQIPDRGNLGPIFGTTTGFANKRVHHQVWGNVFAIDTAYSFCNCWEIGLFLKYQIYKGQNSGHYSRTITPPILDPSFRRRLITDVEWDSFAGELHLGYVF